MRSGCPAFRNSVGQMALFSQLAAGDFQKLVRIEVRADEDGGGRDARADGNLKRIAHDFDTHSLEEPADTRLPIDSGKCFGAYHARWKSGEP